MCSCPSPLQHLPGQHQHSPTAPRSWEPRPASHRTPEWWLWLQSQATGQGAARGSQGLGLLWRLRSLCYYLSTIWPGYQPHFPNLPLTEPCVTVRQAQRTVSACADAEAGTATDREPGQRSILVHCCSARPPSGQPQTKPPGSQVQLARGSDPPLAGSPGSAGWPRGARSPMEAGGPAPGSQGSRRGALTQGKPKQPLHPVTPLPPTPRRAPG